jgi:hypothetical protein
VPRSNGNVSVTSTDVLIAMLSSDLRGSWAGSRDRECALRRRVNATPATSTPTAQPANASGDREDPAD